MLAGAFSCHHLNAHRSDEYIVPEASDGDVTDTACPGKILLVEQHVSLPLLLIKTETDIQATFTSHQDNSPKVHERRETADALSDYCQDVFQREKSHPMRLIYAARRVSEATDSYDFIYSVTTLFTQLRLYLLRTEGKMSSAIITMSQTIFFRLLAHAPEELQREAKATCMRNCG